MDNLGKRDKFLETYSLPKQNREEAESLKRLITASEIESVIKKALDQMASWTNFTKHLKKN